MPFYPRNATSQGAGSTPSPSIVFTFGLGVESIKELGGASAMVAIGISLMESKFIRKEAYLCARNRFGLSKDLRPERRANT
jgi:hypothetical protein